MITLDQAWKLQVGDFLYEIRRAEDDLPRKWRIIEINVNEYALIHVEMRVRQYVKDEWTGGTGHVSTRYHLNQVCLTEAEALEVILISEGITLKDEHDRAIKRHLIYGKPQVMFVI